MATHPIINSFLDKLHKAAEYCRDQEFKYRNMQAEETKLMHINYDNDKTVVVIKRIVSHVVQIMLCPYTWIGATAGLLFALPIGNTPDSTYTTFVVMIWCFAISLWLTMNIYNVRGKKQEQA